MADSLKVFKNESGIEINASATVPYTFDLVTTSATEQAVVKDLALSIVPAAGSPYKFPLALKLGTSTVASAATGINAAFSGSQIVDVSSSLSVEVLAEEAILNYGTMSAMLPISSAMTLLTYDLGDLGGAIAGQGPNIIGSADRTDLGQGGINSTTGFTIEKDGVTYYCFLGGSPTNQLKIYTAAGALYQTINLAEACYWGCVDGGYIYCKPGGAGSYFKKVDIATWAVTNQPTGYLGGMTTSNQGFMDSYDGVIYIRLGGSDTNINRVYLPSGGVNTWSAPTNDTEHIGGLITTNLEGVPYIVEYADRFWYARNINTTESYTGNQVWNQDPTTTNANTMFNVAPGIVFVSNASYNTSCVIDVNFSPPKIDLTTSIIAQVSGTGRAFASTPFKQSPYLVTPRAATCSVVAAGISVT
jgi:hypothetical protein